MPKSNRKIIMEQSLYDLLCAMNEQLDKNATSVCIMGCFMQTGDALERCVKFCCKCTDCIQSWLNEYPF